MPTRPPRHQPPGTRPAGARPPDRRASAARRGYDRRWARARAAYLAVHPHCAGCARRGRRAPAAVVDHITPHRGDARLFWDEANWQPLCVPCHNAKSARER